MRRNSGKAGGRVTMRRVAEEVGVSAMTVSNAYGRPDQLSAALRRRIFEAAEKLGYSGPDPLGRGLSRGRSGTIGVLYQGRPSYAFDDPAAVSFLRGVSIAAEEEDLGLLLVPRSSQGSATTGGAMVDGFIAYSLGVEDRMLRAALDRGVPTVIVDGPEMEGISFVGAEEETVAAETVRYLLDLGHERFGIVSPSPAVSPRAGSPKAPVQEMFAPGSHRRRALGYAVALQGAGVSTEHIHLYEAWGESGPFDRASGSRLPTAVLTASDRLALGTIRSATELGLSVPKDLSVVGYDDTWLAASATPPLTTIYQDHEKKGLLAGQTLISEIEETEQEPARILPTRLVIRDSTAPSSEKLAAGR